MAFVYLRRIRFRDTDAAGVMYFTNALAICHEAYEEALMQQGIDLRLFFSGTEVAVPIVHASVDYRRPSYCGDVQYVHVMPVQLSESEFEVNYALYAEVGGSVLLSQAKTRHVCIHPGDRQRVALPQSLLQWIQSMADRSP